MNSTPNNKQWYKGLDISLKGQLKGIEQIDKMQSSGFCYCIVSQAGIVDRVDVYEDGKRIHYKKFGYDSLGRVIKNMMYSPNSDGGWHIMDDIWYYIYDEESGLRRKKIMQMPSATTAREILYDKEGNKTQETIVSGVGLNDNL